MNFWEFSFSGGVLIILMLLVRRLFQRWISKRMIVWLWCLILLRLLVPFEANRDNKSADMMPAVLGMMASRIGPDMDTRLNPARTDDFTETIFIMEYHIEDAKELVGTAQNNAVVTGSSGLTEPVVGSAEPAVGLAEPAVELAEPVVGLAEPAVGSAEPVVGLAEPPAPFVWLAGMLGWTVFFVGGHVRGYRRYREALPLNHPYLREWRQSRRVTVKQSDRITSPLLYGWLRPVILLPKRMNLADKERLFFVLTHEWVHMRRLDLWKKLLMAAAAVLHWFNPLVWVMLWLFNRDIELSCDEQVVSIFGRTARSGYARALIEMEEERGCPLPLYAYFSHSILEKRIKAIMSYRGHTKLFRASSAAILAVCLWGWANINIATMPAPATDTVTVMPRVAAYIVTAINGTESLPQSAGVQLTLPASAVNRSEWYYMTEVSGMSEVAEVSEPLLTANLAETPYEAISSVYIVQTEN